MINITIEKGKGSFVVEAEGHAEYAEAGKDIVCAAVSILLQGLVGYLDELEEHYHCKAENGKFFLQAPLKDMEGALEFVRCSLNMLHTIYPENVGVPYITGFNTD